MTLQDHHFERDRNRRLEPMHHHAERIADQNHIAMRVDNASSVGMIRGETDDRLAALARLYVWGGQPPDFVLDRHVMFRTPGCPAQPDGRHSLARDKRSLRLQQQGHRWSTRTAR